jgi:hypothetical protein
MSKRIERSDIGTAHAVTNGRTRLRVSCDGHSSIDPAGSSIA